MQKFIAQSITNPALGSTGEQSGQSFVSGLVTSLIGLIFTAAATFFLFYFIGGGIKWISASGDKGKLEEARASVTNAVVGLAVTFCAYAIVALLELIFDVDLSVFDLSTMRVGS